MIIKKIGKKIKRKIRNMNIRYVRKHTKVDPKKIMFIAFQSSYSCNPKAIADEFINNRKGFDLVWAIRKESLEKGDKFPEGIRVVLRNSKEFYKEIASSKFIIQNANETKYVFYDKKPEQVMIQTWHGSLGFKRLDTVTRGKWLENAYSLAKQTDYCISNSSFETDVYRTSYWKDNKILEYGHARNDILFNTKKKNELKDKIKKLYKISNDTKIILYAPTYREDADTSVFDLDYQRILKAVREKFGGKWKMMVRFHYKLRNVDFGEQGKDIVNVTDYNDMQDLLCAVDIGLTDYSSWICDYVLTDNPGFLYINDADSYEKERGFYYPLSETPFPIAKTNDELIENILNFDDKKYKKDRIKFLKDRGCIEKGTASKRIADLISKISKNK